MHCSRRIFALACLSWAISSSVFSGASTVLAQDANALRERFDELIGKASLGDNIGIVVADTSSGERLYTRNAETPRNPASNMKVVTAATALSELGAEFRLRTTLAGSIGPDGGVDTLVLRGEGDPSLSYGDLLSLARRLIDVGVRRVDHIVVDGSFFDDQVLPPAFDQQPHEVAAFRAAVGALSVDRNAYELRVAPGPAADAPANVILRCPDYFAMESNVVTTASGNPKIQAEQAARGDQMMLRIRGEMPATVRGVGYERRVESPLPYAGYCLKSALRAQRVSGNMQVRVGAPPTGLPTLAGHESEPLSVLLQPVGKNSDNFYAEMLLKVIGAHASHRPGSSQAGAERAQKMLEQAGVARGTVQMVNGSGLFRGGSIPPDAIVKVLLHMYRRADTRPEYLTHLSIAGVDGTLRNRLTDLPKPRIVRAKTGTLDDVIALSGYVLGPTPDHAIAFSFLFNGVRGKQWQARALADDLVRALVQHLYASR
jgi:D-alanyl-D-alanine carboxypeptidase/D-alanyl-D-alanine-endopeptidase (penicillin-binding protein 4)